MITTGYELTTAITNVILFIVSIVCLLKTTDKGWKLFYKFMIVDTFFGVIVHGIVMSTTVNSILWGIMCILFVITVNILLNRFMNTKPKYLIIVSLAVIVLLIIQVIIEMDYVLTFVIYVILAFILCLYFIFKNKIKNKNWFVWGIIIQYIGGIFLLAKIRFNYLDQNGICHLFTAITLIMFCIGAQTKKRLK